MKELTRGIWLIEKPGEALNIPSGDIIISKYIDENPKYDYAYTAYDISINTKDTDNISTCYNLEVAQLVAEKIFMNRIEFIELFHKLKKATPDGH